MGTAERRQREAQERKKSILAAARKFFWEKGYEGATIPRIAAEAELAPGTIYLYFPSKEALYVELLLEGYDILLTRLKQATRLQGGPREMGGHLIDAFLGFAREFPQYFDIIFFVLQRESRGGWEGKFPEDQMARLREKEQACKEVAAGILDGADIPPERREIVLDAVWSMLAGGVFYFRNSTSFDQVSAEARRLLLAGVFDDSQG